TSFLPAKRGISSFFYEISEDFTLDQGLVCGCLGPGLGRHFAYEQTKHAVALRLEEFDMQICLTCGYPLVDSLDRMSGKCSECGEAFDRNSLVRCWLEWCERNFVFLSSPCIDKAKTFLNPSLPDKK
ncbi:MAG: hypothetical protein L6Q93_17140, partial [Phycisphaerae bacterium]|nr:hypothetical protein [Phycisphaerae bacterium]